MLMLQEDSKRRIDNLNGATGLVLTVFSCIVTLLIKNIYTHGIFTVWLFLLLAYYGLVKKGAICLLIYGFSAFWLIAIAPRGVKFPSPMLFTMIYKLILPFMPAILTSNISSGKVLATLRKIPMSKSVMLVLVVLVRFAPTVSNEFREVREAMRVRGFTRGATKVLHPLRTLEYVVVPMIFRSVKVADELAVASIVRGIENPCSKESYYNCRFSNNDFLVMGLSFFIGIICVWFKGGI